MNPYIINNGSLSVRWYSVLILIGAFLGIKLFEKECGKHKISQDLAFNMAFWAIIFGLIGARIYYVLFNFSMYSKDVLSIFKIWEGGLAIHGGLIAGFLVILFYSKRFNIRLIRIMDYAAASVFLAQAIGRWGNFFNSEAHGGATTLAHLQSLHIPKFIIDGMNIGGIYYEPTFLYESLLCLIGFVIIMIVKHYKYIKVGMPSSIYLMYYGFVRFFIESMRTDSLMLGGFKAAQIVSVCMFFIGLGIFLISFRKDKFEDLYNTIDDTVIRY